MVYKGCVIKVEKDFAVVLTNSMEYLKVVKKEGLVEGKQILFLEDDIYRENKLSYKKIGMIAAMFLIIILSSFILNYNNNYIKVNAMAIVSLDINPSIEFEIDKNSKVIKVRSINKEAHELIKNEKLVGKSIENSVSIVIDKAKENNYITDTKNSILISTVILEGDDKENKDNIKKQIENKIAKDYKSNNINVLYVEGKKENLDDAHKNNISIGKYEVYEKIKENDEKISIDKVKKMKVHEIANKKLGTINRKENFEKKNEYKEDKALMNKNLEQNKLQLNKTPKNKKIKKYEENKSNKKGYNDFQNQKYEEKIKNEKDNNKQNFKEKSKEKNINKYKKDDKKIKNNKKQKEKGFKKELDKKVK